MNYSQYITINSQEMLRFPLTFNEPFDPSQIPDTITEVCLPDGFKKNLIKQVKFPISVISIVLPNNFNEELEIGFLPEKLRCIQFGSHYNKPIRKGVLPDTVEIIHFGTIGTFGMEKGYYDLDKKDIILPLSVKEVWLVTDDIKIFRKGTVEFAKMFTTV